MSSKKYDKLAEYGYGFSEKNLRRMVQLNEVFPNADCHHHHLAIGDGSQEEKREILQEAIVLYFDSSHKPALHWWTICGCRDRSARKSPHLCRS